MANTFGDVKQTVRSILGDADGEWTTDAYLTPLINHVYNLAIIYLKKTCSPFIERLVTVPNVPIGTTDLADYQNREDGELFGLIRPLKIKWKVSGQPDTFYTWARRREVLPTISPAAPFPLTGLAAEWRAFILYLTPMNVQIDMLVRGEFRPAALTKDTDICAIHPLISSPLAEHSAACALRERTDPGTFQTYQIVGDSVLDDIAADLVMTQQSYTVRTGRANGSRRGWGLYGGGSGDYWW